MVDKDRKRASVEKNSGDVEIQRDLVLVEYKRRPEATPVLDGRERQANDSAALLYSLFGNNGKLKKLLLPSAIHDKTVTREANEHYAAWLEFQERRGDKVVDREIARSCWWQLKMLREAN